MKFLTIAALKEQAGEQPLAAMVDAELQSRTVRQTKTGKPYLVLAFESRSERSLEKKL